MRLLLQFLRRSTSGWQHKLKENPIQYSILPFYEKSDDFISSTLVLLLFRVKFDCLK
jgi:hypothetical protein